MYAKEREKPPTVIFGNFLNNRIKRRGTAILITLVTIFICHIKIRVVRIPQKNLRLVYLGVWCNGSITGSNPVGKGSKPLAPAIWRDGVMASQRIANPSYL